MKNFILNLFLIIFILSSLFIGTIFYFKYIEQPYTHWDSTENMNLSKTYQYGWIPTWFPINAMNIHEQHDIDTNNIWIKFEITDDNNTKFIQNFNQLNQKEIKNLNIRPPFLCNWWFEGLIEQQPSNDNALHAEVYQGNIKSVSNKVFLAKDKLSTDYYIWILGNQ